MNGSDTEVLEVAEHVSSPMSDPVILSLTHLYSSFKREYPPLELMV